MTDTRVVVDAKELHALSLISDPVTRRTYLDEILGDSSVPHEVEADGLVDAAEVIKLRIEKKMNSAGAFARMLFDNNGRGSVVLTIEIIMYRWLMARSEAVRTRD